MDATFLALVFELSFLSFVKLPESFPYPCDFIMSCSHSACWDPWITPLRPLTQLLHDFASLPSLTGVIFQTLEQPDQHLVVGLTLRVHGYLAFPEGSRLENMMHGCW